jgi:hypothetical protein
MGILSKMAEFVQKTARGAQMWFALIVIMGGIMASFMFVQGNKGNVGVQALNSVSQSIIGFNIPGT